MTNPTVIQLDRYAAWPFARFHCFPDVQMTERWFSGYYDDTRFDGAGAAIQAFATYREQAVADAVAQIADWLPKQPSILTLSELAQSIRTGEWSAS